jgi:RNA polymerase sigma factor (sigma-70 family)
VGGVTDEELMARVVAGDLSALGLLFERFKGPLFAFLCRFGSDHALAEDVLVDTFLRAYDRRGTYKIGYRVSTWLYTIAHHLIIDRTRRQTRCTSSDEPHITDPPGTEDTPARDCERSELSDAVRAAIAALPEDQRVAIVLREYEGFSYREIGKVVGATEEAVRVRAHRARRALKRALEPYIDEGPSAAVTFAGAPSYEQ